MVIHLSIIMFQVPAHVVRLAQQVVEHQLKEPLVGLDVRPHVAEHVVPVK